MITIRLLYFGLTLIPILDSWSYEVSHVLKPYTQFETTALSNACLNLKNSKEVIGCNPALFSTLDNYQAFNVFIHGKSDNTGVRNAKKYLFEDISKEDLEKLFTQDNFNSFTMNSGFIFYTKYFVLKYTPYYLVADVLVNNPSFPIISLLLIDRSFLALSSSITLLGEQNSTDYFLSLGVEASYYSEKYLNNVFSAADLTGSNLDEKLKFSKENRGLATLGLYSDWQKFWFIPSISAVIRNIGETREVDQNKINSVSRIEISRIIEESSELGLGYNFNTYLGNFYLGSVLPFKGIYSETDFVYASLGIRHTLGMFSTYLSFSQHFDSISFKSSSKNTSLALVFAREQEIFEFNKTKEKAVYFNMEIEI
jgi:hypothetical protein